MRKAHVAAVVAVLGVAGMGEGAAGVERTPSFRGLGYQLGPRSEANAISADGNTVVGLTGGFIHNEGFRWTEATGMVTLGYLEELPYHSNADAVSGDGSVIVGHNGSIPVRWTAERGMERLPLMAGGRSGIAELISDDGRWIYGKNVEHETGHYILVRWDQQGQVERLGNPGAAYSFSPESSNAIGSTIVGYTRTHLYPSTAERLDGYRWTEGVGFEQLTNDPIGAFLTDMTPDGMYIIGSGHEHRSRGFRLECDASIVWLTHTENDWITPVAISADGSIIVGTDSRQNVLIWDDQNGTRNLKDVLVGELGLDLRGWELFSVAGISDDGMVIAGTGFDPAGFRQAWVAVIPEPSEMGLCVVVLGALQARRRMGIAIGSHRSQAARLAGR